MTANTDYELVCLDILLDHDYTEMLNKGGTQVDVLLCNNPDTVSSTGRDRWLTARYKTNETLCSDHRAYRTNLECTTPSANKPPKLVYAVKKADFKKLNDSIIKNPFTTFCYSNVDHLVHSWYEWIRNLIDKNIPRITKHRATLPPWISNATSHLLKQLQTLNRRKNLYSVSHQLKVRQMERKISTAAEKDLEAFEAEVFEIERLVKFSDTCQQSGTNPQFPTPSHTNLRQLRQIKTKLSFSTTSSQVSLGLNIRLKAWIPTKEAA